MKQTQKDLIFEYAREMCAARVHIDGVIEGLTKAEVQIVMSVYRQMGAIE